LRQASAAIPAETFGGDPLAVIASAYKAFTHAERML
jgi:hypothetical protein